MKKFQGGDEEGEGEGEGEGDEDEDEEEENTTWKNPAAAAKTSVKFAW